MTQATADSGMSFGSSIRTAFRKYADFDGRASRPELWWFLLFSALVGSALGAFDVTTPSGTVELGTSLASVWFIAVLLPLLAVSVRRLRDAGHPWTQLLWLLVPIAGLIVVGLRFCEPSATGPSAP